MSVCLKQKIRQTAELIWFPSFLQAQGRFVTISRKNNSTILREIAPGKNTPNLFLLFFLKLKLKTRIDTSLPPQFSSSSAPRGVAASFQLKY